MNSRVSEVYREFVNSAIELIAELINVHIDVTGVDIKEVSLQDEILSMPEDLVVVPLKYEGCIEEKHAFVLPQSLASILSGLMMGLNLSDVVEKVDDETIANISDAFSQVGVVISNSLSMSLNNSIQSVCEGASVGTMSIASTLTSDEVLKGDINLNINGIDSSMSYYMPGSLAKLFEEQEPEQEPQPVVAENGGIPIGDDFLDVMDDEEHAEPQPVQAEVKETAGTESTPFTPLNMNESAGMGSSSPNIDILMDVPLEVTVELGRAKMSIKEVLDIGEGSIIELNKLAGEPVDFYVNGKLISRGEVVVIDENFGVRITEIVSPAERITSL